MSVPTSSLGQDELVLSASENANNVNRELELNASSGTEDEPGPESNAAAADQNDNQHADHVTYEAGVAIYTDPDTQHRYKWDKEANEWLPENPSSSVTTLENEHYRWDTAKKEWVLKQTPVTENEHYRWCEETQKWLPKAGADGTTTIRYENGERVYTDRDGMTFFWDAEKSAWFPKITDDFMAMYQMNYGFVDNTTSTTIAATVVTEKAETPPPTTTIENDNTRQSDQVGDTGKGAATKRKAVPEPPKWFELEPEHNTKVYVSNLPLDMTEEEFVALVSKCGLVTRDIRTQKLKAKLYVEPDGSNKGDGLCDYIKMESVELALSILDGMDVRGKRISVTRAKFQMRGDYDPKLKPRKKQKREKEKERKLKEKLFDWRPDRMRGERGRHERIVVVRNLFAPATFEVHVERLLEYQQRLRDECKKCGQVRRVVVYDRHPEGVAQVTMGDPEEADLVIQLLHGRQFGERKLTAETWDGKTRFRMDETKEDAEKRIQRWNEHLAKVGEQGDEQGGSSDEEEVAQKDSEV